MTFDLILAAFQEQPKGFFWNCPEIYSSINIELRYVTGAQEAHIYMVFIAILKQVLATGERVQQLVFICHH